MSRAAAAPLPGMTTALDMEAMSVLVADSLADAGESLEVEELRVLDVRYRPQEPCWVLYRLKGRDADGTSRRQLLSGQLRDPGSAEPELPAQIQDRYGLYAPEWLRSPALRVASLPMTLYPYPVDTALPGLFEAVSPDAMKSRLRRLWTDQNVRVRTVRVHDMGYTPHARAAFGYEVLCEDRDRGLPIMRRLIGKTHAKKPAYRLFQDSLAVWRAGGKRIGLAPPVGYIGAIGLTLQERVEGVRLGGLVDQPGLDRSTRRTARAIARLHSLMIPLNTRRKLSEEVRGVDRWSGILMEIRPDLKTRVAGLRARITSELAARLRMSAPVHADFHHTNVLVDGDRVTIIDLDEMAFGDPMLDVGRFMASLRVPSRRVFGRIDALAGAQDAFLEEYMRLRDGDERRARLFESASLLTAAGSSFRVQRAGWEEEVELLIAESERVLGLATRGEQYPAAILDGRTTLDAKEQRRWARDGEFMQAALDPFIRDEFGALIERCRVRTGDSSECHMTVKGDRGGERWDARFEAHHKPRGSRSLADGLKTLASALDGVPGAPALPRPVAALPKIGHLVWETPTGESLAQLTEDIPLDSAIRAVARGLRAVHQSGVELPRATDLEGRLRQVRRSVESIQDEHPELFESVRPLFEAVCDRLADAPDRLCPTLRIVHPHHVAVGESGAALRRVEDLVMSHPLLDVGDLSARLLRLGIEREDASSEEDRRWITGVGIAKGAVEILSAAYHEASGDEAARHEVALWLPAFQALSLVGLVARRPASASVGSLLDMAAAALASHDAMVQSPDGTPPTPPWAATPEEAERDLAAAVARLCRGRTAVLQDARMADTLREMGIKVVAEAADGPRTVVLSDLGRADAPEDAIQNAWDGLEVGGRLIVVAHHSHGARPPEGTRAFSRRELWRLLRPIARPSVGSEQPFDWLLMSMKKSRQRRSRPKGAARDRRYEVTASLCRGRVLELGCGEGHLSGLLTARGHDVTGVDLNGPKVRTAEQTYPGARFLQGDIRTVPLDDTFDTVVLAEVLEHVTEGPGDEILARAWSFVAPGGRLIVSVPNENLIPHPNHLRQFDLEALTELLSRYGAAKAVTRQPYKWLMMFVDRAPV